MTNKESRPWKLRAVIFNPNSMFTRSRKCRGKQRGYGPSPKTPEASTPQQDRVALSNRGQSIADAQRAMASVPDVRESLVSQIQNDLQNGILRL
jgi:hypothetical protein